MQQAARIHAHMLPYTLFSQRWIMHHTHTQWRTHSSFHHSSFYRKIKVLWLCEIKVLESEQEETLQTNVVCFNETWKAQQNIHEQVQTPELRREKLWIKSCRKQRRPARTDLRVKSLWISYWTEDDEDYLSFSSVCQPFPALLTGSLSIGPPPFHTKLNTDLKGTPGSHQSKASQSKYTQCVWGGAEE